MKNEFVKEYEWLKNYRIRLDDAVEEEELKSLNEEFHKFESEMKSEKGILYTRFFWNYVNSMDVHNDRIDFDNVIWDHNVELFVSELKKVDINEFTFSSTSDNAIEIAWLLQKHGCTLKGVVEINNQYPYREYDENGKIHALLFTIS